MKLKKVLALFTASVLMTGVLVGCGSKEDTSSEGGSEVAKPITLKLSIGTNQGSKDLGAFFEENIEERTEGRILIDIYGDNQLGGDREVAEATQYGDIEICLVSTTPISTSVPNLNVFDAPFLFLNREHAYSVLDGEVGQEIAGDLEDIGIKVLGFAENGFRCLTNNNVEVRTPDDLDGLKIRVMESEIHMATWEALGASPTPMAFTELFTALQQKTIDAQENPMENNYANRFYEVQDYCVDTYHVYTPFLFGMSLDKFNELSEQDQAILLEVSKEAVDYQRERAAFYETDSIEKMEEYGTNIIYLTDEERLLFRESVDNVYDLVKEKMTNPELLDKALVFPGAE